MAATLSRRALSLPARAVEIASGSTSELDLYQPDVEARVATSPSIVDPRSPTTTVATFSPVFDLELGGSCASTPQDRQSNGGISRRCAAAGPPIPLRPLAPATPAAAALQKLREPKSLVSQKDPGALPTVAVAAIATSGAAVLKGGSGCLDRSASDLQVSWARRNGGSGSGTTAATHPSAVSHSELLALPPAGERVAELCKPASELEMELAKRLRVFRTARISKQPPAHHQQQQQPSSGSTSTSTGVAPGGPPPGEIEALASELQSAGFLMQILDGTRLSKDARSCLRTLKHRFLVCMGRAQQQPLSAPPPPPAPPSGHFSGDIRTSLRNGDPAGETAWGRLGAARQTGETVQDLVGGGVASGTAAAGGQEHQHQPPQHPSVVGEEQLSEPLVVEVRFREQFLIASPTQAYQLLLLALPVVFVGPMRRLDAVVDIMAREVAAVFKAAKRPLPPWRTKGAMLSKWAPAQLGELQRLMRCEEMQHQHPQQKQQHQRKQQQQQQQLEEQEEGEPQEEHLKTEMVPADRDMVPRGPSTTSRVAASSAFITSMQPPPATTATTTSADIGAVGGTATNNTSTADHGGGGGGGGEPEDAVMGGAAEVASISNIAPSRKGVGAPAATDADADGAADADGDGDVSELDPRSEGILSIIGSDSLGRLMGQTLTRSTDRVEAPSLDVEDGSSNGTGGDGSSSGDGSGGGSGGAVVVTGSIVQYEEVADEDEDATKREGGGGNGVTRLAPMAAEAALTAAQAEAGSCGLLARRGDPSELSFPILPEVVTMADAGVALAAVRPVGHLVIGRQGEGELTAAAAAAAAMPPLLQQEQEKKSFSGNGAAAVAAAAEEVAVTPTFWPLGGLSALSPFACVSVPEQYESEYGEQDGYCGGGGGDMRPSPWSANLPTVPGGEGAGSNIGNGQGLPEFTFKHTALESHDPSHGEYDADLDLGRRDAPGGSGAAAARRGPTLPLPTPPRLAPLAAAAAAATADALPGDAAAVVAAAPPEKGRSVLASPPATAAARVSGLDLKYQPLASGALGLCDGVSAAATAASPAAAAAAQRPAGGGPPKNLSPAASHPPPCTAGGGGGGGGGGYHLQFPRPDTLHITRRSSSDLHRAAEKFKKAKSLLATALRLAKGSGGGGSGSRDASAAAAAAAAAVGACGTGPGLSGPQQQQQQQQQRGDLVPRDAKAALVASGSGAAPAVARPPDGGAAAAAVTPGNRPGVGGGAVCCTRVALAGGVMTQPSGDEPLWARRIRTVKWDQSEAAAAAAVAGGGDGDAARDALV